jgi:hypothetical protein
MTRKDYILLAEALRVQYLNTKVFANDGMSRGVLSAAEEIAAALQRDSSRFDRDHFLAVVRGEKELHSRPSRNGVRS